MIVYGLTERECIRFFVEWSNDPAMRLLDTLLCQTYINQTKINGIENKSIEQRTVQLQTEIESTKLYLVGEKKPIALCIKVRLAHYFYILDRKKCQPHFDVVSFKRVDQNIFTKGAIASLYLLLSCFVLHEVIVIHQFRRCWL